MENINYLFHAVRAHVFEVYIIWVCVCIFMNLIGGMSFRLLALRKGKLIGENVCFSYFGYDLKPIWKFIFFLLIISIPVFGWWLTKCLIKISAVEHKKEAQRDIAFISTGTGFQSPEGAFVEMQKKIEKIWKDDIWVIQKESPLFQKYYKPNLIKF